MSEEYKFLLLRLDRLENKQEKHAEAINILRVQITKYDSEKKLNDTLKSIISTDSEIKKQEVEIKRTKADTWNKLIKALAMIVTFIYLIYETLKKYKAGQ
jgi:replicative DNA helicase